MAINYSIVSSGRSEGSIRSGLVKGSVGSGRLKYRDVGLMLQRPGSNSHRDKSTCRR